MLQSACHIEPSKTSWPSSNLSEIPFPTLDMQQLTTFITEPEARCAEVWTSLLISCLRLHTTTSVYFMCVTKCNRGNAYESRLSKIVHLYPYLYNSSHHVHFWGSRIFVLLCWDITSYDLVFVFNILRPLEIGYFHGCFVCGKAQIKAAGTTEYLLSVIRDFSNRPSKSGVNI